MAENIAMHQCSKMFRVATLALTCALAGCTALAGSARIDGATGTAARDGFPGLLPTAPGQTTYIFQIHGINTPDPTIYANELLSQIPNYGYTRQTIAGPVNAFDVPGPGNSWNEAMISKPVVISGQNLASKTFDHFGVYEKDVFTKASTKNKVVVFTYFWRYDLWKVDGQYLDPDIQSNRVPWPSTQKSYLNEILKTELMDTGLSDVAGYLGPIGPVEREGVESAVCAMFADAIGSSQAQQDLQLHPGAHCLEQLEADNTLAPGNVEFDFLSHSLGSRMLFDVLSPYDPDAKDHRGQNAILGRTFIANNTKVFFMAANQLPILAIGEVDVNPPSAVRTPEVAVCGTVTPETTFFDLRTSPTAACPSAPGLHPRIQPPVLPKLTIVAFQDPDDFLGYKATDALIGGSTSNGINIVDVVHRNSGQFLFLIDNPLKAHDNEMSEPHSRQMILCGAEAKPNGTLKASACK